MNCLTTLLLALSCVVLSAQSEHTLDTEITDVTVFLKKAQVTRTGSINLPKGEHILKLKSISPYIDKKSIQFRANQNVAVLAVNYQLDYIGKDEQQEDHTKSLNDSIDSLVLAQRKNQIMIEVIEEDVNFLRSNRKVVNEEKVLTVSEVKSHATYQNEAMIALKLKRLELDGVQKEIRNELIRYRDQQAQYEDQSEAKGLIEIKVDVRQNTSIPVEISYVTDNASWFPSYDVTVNDLSEPMILSYKANLIQNTKEDWTDVSLTFSSNNPNLSPVAPELQIYYLNYGILPPSYGETTSGVSGVVTDAYGEAVIGASILVKGTTIGTITDLDGSFELPQITQGKSLQISFTGYVSQEVPLTGQFMNIVLQEGQLLDEVVVTGHRRKNKRSGAVEAVLQDELQGKAAGVRIRGYASIPNAALPVTLAEKTTNVSFKIDQPYTVKSDNQASVITMSTIAIPVTYRYHTIPKINTNAYLLASIDNWEQYNFLAGQVSVVLDDTYIGSSLLELSGAEKTLQLSIGIDKSVSISRERITDYTDKKFLSKKQTESIGWKTIVKNNKEQSIVIKVLDQVPVSTNDDIEVDIQELSRANHNQESGLCTWVIDLDPNQQKQLDLKYEVKYPKRTFLTIE